MGRLLLLAATLILGACSERAEPAASERELYTVVERDLPWRSADDVGSELTPERVTRGSISSEGVRLASPGRAELVVNAQPGDRLRLRFVRAAPAEGEPEPADVDIGLTLGEAGGRLGAGALAWRAGETWQDVELDLSPLAGGEATLVLDAGPEPGEVLIGQVLQLRRASVAHPNVIFYLEDALRADHLGSYGYARPTDPHLARLGEEGVHFSQVFASSNWTRPAVSTLLTGLDPGDHGNTAEGGRIPDAAKTLAQVYADAGYLTAAFITNIHAGVWSGLERGFDLHFDRKAFPRSSRDSSLTSSLINDPLFAFLEEHRDELVFVYVHSTDPHGPYRSVSEDLFAVMDVDAPADVPLRVPEIRREQWSEWTLNYDGEIHHNDRSLRALDEQLAALDLMRDTLFAFTSDHGEAFCEHDRWGHRNTMHQEEVGVPWVLRWPAGLVAGRVVNEPCSHLDMAPTLLALSGLPTPEGWRGRDLSALCLGTDASLGSVPPTEPMLLWGGAEDGPQLACVLPPWKLVAVPGVDGEPLPVALYNLVEDPDERHDRLREASLRPVVEGLLDPLRDMVARHARSSDVMPLEDALSGLDEDDLDWLRAMGYLK